MKKKKPTKQDLFEKAVTALNDAMLKLELAREILEMDVFYLKGKKNGLGRSNPSGDL